MQKHSERLMLRLTRQEKAELRGLADVLELSLSDTIREGLRLCRVEWLRTKAPKRAVGGGR